MAQEIDNWRNMVSLNNWSTSDDEKLPEGEKKLQDFLMKRLKSARYLNSHRIRKLFRSFAHHNKDMKLWSEDDPTPIFIQKTFWCIGERVKAWGGKVTMSTCEITKQQYYILSSPEMPTFSMGAFYTEPERQLFTKIVNSIFKKQNSFAITQADCYTILDGCESLATLSRMEMVIFLKRMISLKFFIEVDSRHQAVNQYCPLEQENWQITVGFRTLCEFGNKIDLYRNVFGECCRCQKLLLNGLRCVNCTTLIHRHCLPKYLVSISKFCVSCKTCWENKEKSFILRTRSNSLGSRKLSDNPPSVLVNTDTSSRDETSESTNDADPQMRELPPSTSKSLTLADSVDDGMNMSDTFSTVALKRKGIDTKTTEDPDEHKIPRLEETDAVN